MPFSTSLKIFWVEIWTPIWRIERRGRNESFREKISPVKYKPSSVWGAPMEIGSVSTGDTSNVSTNTQGSVWNFHSTKRSGSIWSNQTQSRSCGTRFISSSKRPSSRSTRPSSAISNWGRWCACGNWVPARSDWTNSHPSIATSPPRASLIISLPSATLPPLLRRSTRSLGRSTPTIWSCSTPSPPSLTPYSVMPP